MITRDEHHLEASEVWIGLVEMLARRGCPNDIMDSDEAGGYTEMLAWCATEAEFRERVKEALDHYGLDLGEIEDPEPLRMRLSKRAVNPKLFQKAEEVEATHRVRFYEPIHSYPWDERQDW